MRGDRKLSKLDKIDNNLERVVARLKQRKVNIEVKPLVDQKLIKQWSQRCVEQLRQFCEEVLTELYTHYTPRSVNELLNEVVQRGLRIEVALALASQYDPLLGNDALLRRYIDEGYVDWDYLASVINGFGYRFGVDELRNLLSQPIEAPKKGRFNLPRSLGFSGIVRGLKK
jgi:tyrosine-protein phosphatase YwqE